MLFLILFLSTIIISFCLTKDDGRKTFFGVIAALIYFPLGVILSLTKKYK